MTFWEQCGDASGVERKRRGEPHVLPYQSEEDRLNVLIEALQAIYSDRCRTDRETVGDVLRRCQIRADQALGVVDAQVDPPKERKAA